jgi:hypothetical protein
MEKGKAIYRKWIIWGQIAITPSIFCSYQNKFMSERERQRKREREERFWNYYTIW